MDLKKVQQNAQNHLPVMKGQIRSHHNPTPSKVVGNVVKGHIRDSSRPNGEQVSG